MGALLVEDCRRRVGGAGSESTGLFSSSGEGGRALGLDCVVPLAGVYVYAWDTRRATSGAATSCNTRRATSGAATSADEFDATEEDDSLDNEIEDDEDDDIDTPDGGLGGIGITNGDSGGSGVAFGIVWNALLRVMGGRIGMGRGTGSGWSLEISSSGSGGGSFTGSGGGGGDGGGGGTGDAFSTAGFGSFVGSGTGRGVTGFGISTTTAGHGTGVSFPISVGAGVSTSLTGAILGADTWWAAATGRSFIGKSPVDIPNPTGPVGGARDPPFSETAVFPFLLLRPLVSLPTSLLPRLLPPLRMVVELVPIDPAEVFSIVEFDPDRLCFLGDGLGVGSTEPIRGVDGTDDLRCFPSLALRELARPGIAGESL